MESDRPIAPLTQVPPDARLGYISLAIFMVTAVFEMLFFSWLIFVSTGTTETFPFAPNIGMTLMLAGPIIHLAGSMCAFVGIFRDQERALASIGLAVNSLVFLIFVHFVVFS